MIKEPYNHPFLGYEALAAMLIQRGMRGDKEIILQRIEDVGYQRLQAYWGTDSQGLIHVHIDDVWTQYCFDRQIRLALLDAIERIEVAVRNRLVHCYCEEYGPFGYLEPVNFGKTDVESWERWVSKLHKSARNSSLLSIRKFFDKYSNDDLPLWLACELMDFGSTVFFYSHVKLAIQKKVSRSLGLPSPIVLASWLRALNDVRNACAHHNRVWNRTWAKMPALPANSVDWYAAYDVKSREWRASDGKIGSFAIAKTGVILTICRYLLRQVASSSMWHERLMALFSNPRFSGLPHQWMGLPYGWENHPLWR